MFALASNICVLVVSYVGGPLYLFLSVMEVL